MLLTLLNISASYLLRFYRNGSLRNEHQLLDSRNLITLKNGYSSKSRNLSPEKYFYSKFMKLKSRENKW